MNEKDSRFSGTGVDYRALTRLLRDRLHVPPATRFAPTPSGLLHEGHLVNAILVWGTARALGGRVVLRIEDHDRERSRPEYEKAALADLETLGFMPDEGRPEDFSAPETPYRQSDNDAKYAATLAELRARGHVYECDCSRSAIRKRANQRGETIEPGREIPYDGFCRDRGLPPGPERGARLRLDAEEIIFEDALLGSLTQNPARECGDPLLRDRRGNWTYHYACVLDDARQGINLIIRGEDLLASTGRQESLRRLLGAPPVLYAHHPLIYDESGEKLGKSRGSPPLSARFAAGVAPEEEIGRIAYLLGLLPEARPWPASRLGELFQ